MTRTLAWRLGALSLWGALAGCGGNGPSQPSLEVGAAARWTDMTATSPAFGYDMVVLLSQRTSPDNTCPKLPASTTLIVNGGEIAPVFDSGSGCLDTPIDLGLSPGGGTITVDVREDGDVVAHAEFDALTPGAGATLASPADGMVHPGDDIVIVPPADLPTAMLLGSDATFYIVDAGRSVRLPNAAQRLADGVHVKALSFTGRAAVTVQGMPYIPEPRFSCSGFAACVANADGTLGPVYLTGVP
jgi:hypothetical protein